MALINCPECGKDFSDKAAACPNCGCPIESMTFQAEDTTQNNMVDSSPIWNTIQNTTKNAIENWKDSYHATKKVGPVKIDENHMVFQINGTVPVNGKKSGIMGKSIKGLVAVSTVGMSVVAEKALGIGEKKVGSNEWHEFSDLISYDLIEDDSVVTTGGTGQALVGGALFGGVGAIAGGITGKRVQKKRIESLYIKATLNSFKNPCILIPIITKPTKTNSKEYQNAFEEAQKILSILDVITHNK